MTAGSSSRLSLVSIDPEGSHNHPARDARALAQGRLSLPKRDSKRTKLALQVLALAQHFSKLYWKDEVRSSGKNAVFELKMRRLGNSKYSRHFQKARIIGRFLAYSLTEKCRRR